jgi:hypothetical protein
MNLNKLSKCAAEELSKILEDIPELKGNAYLVFSSPFGQCKLTVNKLEIYKSFPEFFNKDENHDKINQLLSSKNESKELKGLLETLTISEDVLIEFRFEKLDYKLIESLKKHPRVRQPVHMMRSAYIRVVLSPVNEYNLD